MDTPCLAEWPRFFYDEGLKSCIDCPFGCETCSSRSKCLTCTPPLFM